MSLQATLEPLILNRRLVGALLVVTYAGALPQCRMAREAPVSAPFVSPVTWTGGERADGPPAATKAASSFLRRFKKRSQVVGAPVAPTPPSGRLLRGLAAALSQVAMGPHLQSVSRVGITGNLDGWMGALGGWMGARTPHLQTAALGGRLGTVSAAWHARPPSRRHSSPP